LPRRDLKSLSAEEKRQFDYLFAPLIFVVRDYWRDKKTGLLSVVIQTFKPVNGANNKNLKSILPHLMISPKLFKVLQIVQLKPDIFSLIIETPFPRQAIYELIRWSEICKQVLREKGVIRPDWERVPPK